MNTFNENYVSLSHSTTGGDTRKNLELLVLDKKYLTDQMGILKKSRQAHITGASLWWGEESSSCAVDRAKLIIILTTSA